MQAVTLCKHEKLFGPKRLRAYNLAALAAACGQHPSSARGLHPLTETVDFRLSALFWLVRSFHTYPLFYICLEILYFNYLA